MTNPIKLSFCIPTYNRADIVYQLVNDILKSTDTDIEVVVRDNASTDDTLYQLQAINDARLVVFSANENEGGLLNGVNVANKARGEFLVFLTDKDHVDWNEVTKFKLFLLGHPNLAGGYCEFNSDNPSNHEFFFMGYQAMSQIAYQCRHPTGYFFRNELFKPIRQIERFSDFKIVGLFSFEFVFGELLSKGDGAVYHAPIFSLETSPMAARHKSHNISGESKDAFYMPDARLKLAINFTKHINTLQLTSREKKMLFVDVFIRQLLAATIGYRVLLKNKNLCSHYYLIDREVRLSELLFIGLSFYKDYFNGTESVWEKNFTKKILFNLSLFFKCIQKTVFFIRKYIANEF
jgi:glycosyltransferase involved in cell wall biosynthesis